MNISYEIISEKAFDHNVFDGEGLAEMSDGELALINFEYDFEVLVKNQNSDQKVFNVVFQCEERSSAITAYSGYEMGSAYRFGCDSDETQDLIAFCDHDDSVIEALKDRAELAAKKELDRLTIG